MEHTLPFRSKKNNADAMLKSHVGQSLRIRNQTNTTAIAWWDQADRDGTQQLSIEFPYRRESDAENGGPA